MHLSIKWDYLLPILLLVAITISIKYALNYRDTLYIESTSPPPKFTFYQKLQKASITVPKAPEQISKQEWLMAGSFSNQSNAIKRAEKINDMSLPTTLEMSGNGYHRIMVGPFTSRQELQKARENLLQAKISSTRIWRQEK